VLVLDMIEILHPLGKYKYDTWRILSVKFCINNCMRLRSCIRNVNKGYEIHPDFVSLVRESNFASGLHENLYKLLQYFEEICATLMISGMNHETVKWKAFPFSQMGWAK
jgi:hypothetical protein